MEQNALTVIIPIKRGEVTALKDRLTTIGDDIRENPHLKWEISPSTHFARFVVLDPADLNPEGKSIAALKDYQSPRLLFTSNHDGSFEAYMRELVTTFGASMELIWSCCEGYPAGASTDVAKFTKFISDHQHLPSPSANPFKWKHAFYRACQGQSVATIEESILIREALNKMLDSDSPEAKAILNDLPVLPRPVPPAATSPQPADAAGAEVTPPAQSGIESFLEGIVGIRPGMNPNLPVISPERQVAVEDRVTQNQMTVIVPIRRSLKSRVLLRVVLWAVNMQAAKSNGSLSGLTTIHFARWVIIDDGKNLFFESNFDGSWENYIDDFVDRASLGMNIIWGNCDGFPDAGCKDIEWFKKYIRDNQIPAQVFYSAYPESSIKNNLNDLQIARTVKQFLNAQEIKLLLQGSYGQIAQSMKKLLREPAIELFLRGSYNLGVIRAIDTPLQQQGTPLKSPALKSKKPALFLALAIGAGVLAFWLKKNKRG